MKKLLSISLFILFGLSAFAQNDVQTMPDLSLKDVNGKPINMADYSKKGKIVIVSFWATWCSPCKKELNNYAELYADWAKETGVKIIAVSIDDQRSVARVAPYVNSVSWEYDVLLDANKAFANAMGVVNVPHTFLIDGSGNIVWQHNNYADGDEEELHEQLVMLTGK